MDTYKLLIFMNNLFSEYDFYTVKNIRAFFRDELEDVSYFNFHLINHAQFVISLYINFNRSRVGQIINNSIDSIKATVFF